MLSTILICITFPVLAYLIYSYLYQKYSRKFYYARKIPGPKGHPLVGNTIEILKPLDVLFKNDRARAISYYPIYKVALLNELSVFLAKPEDIELVLSSTKHLQKHELYELLHPWLGTGLLTSFGTKWHNRRKLLTPAFHFTILQEFVDIFNKETLELIRNIEKQIDRPYTNVVPLIIDFTLRSIVETSAGKKLDWQIENSRNYRKAVDQFGKTFVYLICRPWLMNPFGYLFNSERKKFDRTVAVLHKFTNDVISEKKKQLKDSLPYSTRKRLAMLDLLLKAQIDGVNIDDEGIREEVDTFVFEGHDTTSIAICFALLVLANHQQYQEEIYMEIIDVLGDTEKLPTFNDLQNLPFTERCIKEILRLYPSVPSIGRTLSEDMQTTTGYFIPKGTTVFIGIYDVHHSPFIYDDPEAFDPDRFLPENIKSRHPFSYIPFSAGPRNCIGQRYALLEIKSALCGILRRFKLEAIDSREDIVCTADLVLRTRDGIRVKFVPRQ